MSKLQDNINISINMMENSFSDSNRFSKIYSFPTENVLGCFSKYDFNEKDCLTVLSSSAQLFNMYLNGANSVTSFDINSRTEYYFYFLKAFVISGLPPKYLLNLFTTDDEYQCSKIFKIICNHLDGDSKIYFETLYDRYGCKMFNSLKLFHHFECSRREVPYYSGYLIPDKLRNLRKIIRDKEPNFINCDIKELEHNISSKYDFMYFSNIIQYCDLLFENCTILDSIYSFKRVVLSLANYLNTDGEMYVGYLYDLEHMISFNPWTNQITREDIFEKDNFSYHSFLGFGSLEKDCTDACLIYKKSANIKNHESLYSRR